MNGTLEVLNPTRTSLDEVIFDDKATHVLLEDLSLDRKIMSIGSGQVS